MPLRACELDRGIIAHDMGGHLRQRLGLCRVDLARHDRAARLVLGQDQFAQARPRTRPQKPDVIGNLVARPGHRGERARHEHHRIMRRQRLKFVGGRDKRQAGDLGHLRRDGRIPALRGVQTGAHSGAALCQLIDTGQTQIDPRDALPHLMRIAREFLPQRQRRGVLRMGTADLDDVLELFRFGLEPGQKLGQPRQKHVARRHGSGNMHGGGKGVVG